MKLFAVGDCYPQSCITGVIFGSFLSLESAFVQACNIIPVPCTEGFYHDKEGKSGSISTYTTGGFHTFFGRYKAIYCLQLWYRIHTVKRVNAISFLVGPILLNVNEIIWLKVLSAKFNMRLCFLGSHWKQGPNQHDCSRCLHQRGGGGLRSIDIHDLLSTINKCLSWGVLISMWKQYMYDVFCGSGERLWHYDVIRVISAWACTLLILIGQPALGD